MSLFLNNPSKYLYLLIFLYFFFIPRFYSMNNIEKNKFFNILSKSHLISIFFLLIIGSMKINDNSSLINLSYVYCTITVNTIAAIIIFYLKLDIVINNALKRFIGQEFVHKTMVIFYAMILFIYLFFPRFNFILKHIATILTILLSLNFLSIKYLNEE